MCIRLRALEFPRSPPLRLSKLTIGADPMLHEPTKRGKEAPSSPHGPTILWSRPHSGYFSDSLYVKLVHRERPGPLRKVGAHARRKGALSVYFFGLARFAAQHIVGVVLGVSEDPIKARSLVNNRVRKNVGGVNPIAPTHSDKPIVEARPPVRSSRPEPPKI